MSNEKNKINAVQQPPFGREARGGAKGTIKIMIADDHQIIIDGIKSLLKEVKNITIVAEANNGRDAIAIIEKTPVNIILMDIEMPILNGCHATAIITTRYPDIKVIALT